MTNLLSLYQLLIWNENANYCKNVFSGVNSRITLIEWKIRPMQFLWAKNQNYEIMSIKENSLIVYQSILWKNCQFIQLKQIYLLNLLNFWNLCWTNVLLFNKLLHSRQIPPSKMSFKKWWPTLHEHWTNFIQFNDKNTTSGLIKSILISL